MFVVRNVEMLCSTYLAVEGFGCPHYFLSRTLRRRWLFPETLIGRFRFIVLRLAFSERRLKRKLSTHGLRYRLLKNKSLLLST